MDLFKNFFSQFRKPITKPEKTPNTKISIHSEENNSLKPIKVAYNILGITDLEIRVVSENSIASNENKTANNLRMKTSANTDSKNTKKILHESLDATKTKDNKIAFVFANKSITITNIIGNFHTDSGARNELNNKPSQRVVVERHAENNDRKDMTEPCFDLEIGGNNSKAIEYANTSNKVFDSAEIINSRNVAVPSEDHNSAHSLAIKNTNEISEMVMKDQTIECLKEFDNILAEVVRNKVDSKVDDAEVIALDEIDDILYEELRDLDSTGNFQEIKQIHTINLNKELKIANDSNNVVVGYIGHETVITRLEIASNATMEDNIDTISISSEESLSKITFKDTMQDNIDVISISSDDAASTDGEESIHLEVTENETVKTGKGTKQSQISEVTPKTNSSKEHSEINDSKTVETDKETEQCKLNDLSNDKLTDDIETFSVSVSDDELDTDDDCGYHSSDFEFISEEEAKLDGFIINFNPKRHRFSKNAIDSNAKVRNDPYGAGPSSNVGRFDYNKKVIEDKRNMENYAVPQENEFLNMFQGELPGLPTCEIHFLENKSVRTRAPMMVQYEGVGFDMNLAMQRVESSDEEYRDEAKESMKKILQMYPGENVTRKRRRRY